MKSKFTLLAIALLSVCAFAATTWKASEETPLAAGSTLIDDELVTAKTVYETTLKSAVKTIAGEEFTHYIQVRNAANPSADAPDGTEQSGSTSIVLEVKKDVSLKIYYRRQCKSGESGVYESNDGKDLKIFSRADFSVLDGTITVSEETEDQAYAWVTKDYQLTGGETYVISARGTTINYYGMTFEALEVPVTPIVLDLATGTDITTALNEAVEGAGKAGNITINLASDGNYTVSGSLVAPAGLTINGNGATIDASSNNDPFIALSTVPSVEEVNSYFRVDGIKIADVTVNDIKNSIVYDNNTKYCVVDLTIDNSVLKLSTEGVKYESLIAFQQGGVKDVNITNSTIYGNGAVAKYFIRYNNSARLDRYGFDTSSDFQTMNYQSNTFYKVIADGGQWGNYNGVSGQVYSKFDVQKNIWVDCGTDIIRRMAGGRFNGNNPMTFAFNTYFNAGENLSESEASYDNSGNILTSDPGFADAANGDFTISGEQQVANQTGDPRWLPAPEPEDIEISPLSGDITEALAIASEGKLVKNITINLASDGNYTVSGSLVAPAGLTINGNGATIDASSNNDPFIALSTVPSAEEVNSYFRVDGIKIADVTVNDIKNSIVYDNNTKYCVVNLTIDNSVLKLSTEGVKYESLIAFQQGGVKDVNITNSTIYGNGAVAKYFIRYNNSARLDRYGFDTSSDFQTMNYQNNTFYKVLADGGQWGNYNGVSGQVYSKFDVQKNIWVDCGTDIIRRMAGGRFNGNNPMTFAFNTYFNAGEDRSESEASYDNSGNILTSDPGFADAANGDFTISGEQQIANQTGDPRWLVEVVENPFDGKYYIYNVVARKYWGAANDWGTRASLIEHPDYVTLAQISDGVYTMETQVSNGGTSYYFGGDYMDGQPINLTITKAGNDNYTIANAEGQFYGYDGSSTILGKNVGEGDNALWKIISEEEMLASLNTATASEPVDATFLIIDHTFGRNNRNVGAWIVSEDCTNSNLTGGNSDKHSAESYHSTFTISQVLNNVPNGVYSFQAQGFYRQDGSDNDNLAQFFINNETTLVPLKTGTENSMADACASFENGMYKADPIYVQVEDGQITLGVKNEANPNLWVIWDNFVLTYYGADATLDEVKNAAIISQLADLRKKATDLQGHPEVEVVNNALATTLEETADVTASSPVDDINAAIEKLTGVIESAEASITAKNVLPAMKKLIDETNVYTEEAYNEYYGQWLAKYEAGTLTKAEASALQDPSLTTGWHAPITVDNFLLSVWDTNVDFVDAPYYINTWSTEGENDGSGFRVPFFEYWTGDDQSLGERTLTATMTNLPVGVYDVTAWVRVRVKNGVEDAPTGITLQANDGEAVPVTAGAQVGESQFYLDTFTAQGEVGEDGILKIKFNVAADNNISWLSFKNVNYAIEGIGEPLYVSPNLGEDIAAELASVMETNPYPSKVVIELAGGSNYAVNSPLIVNCPLEFIVYIPMGGREVGYANIDVSALSGPMIQISDNIHSDFLADNGFYQLGDIKIDGIKVKGLTQQLIYGNKVKAQYGTLTLENSIIEVAGGNKTVFDFNGGGVVEKLSINSSTIYGNPQHTGQLYSSQSGQKATEAGLVKQTISITNSTLYNIAYSKNVNTHRQANQTWLAYELKNSIIIDCGKQGQFVKGLNGGQQGANPTWMIDGNSFQWTVDGVLTDISASEETADDAEPVANNVEGVVVFANDITTGDFTLGECPQKTAKIGDPRWLFGPTVGIDNVNVNTENDVWYNLQGVRVTTPTKGLFIKNGKKVVVK